MTCQFDYYYGVEAEQFAFYRVPKILFKDERFKGLSSDAKLLYGLMLDRMSLSMKNGWLDETNRVYIYYTTEHIMDDLGCAREKCTKVVAELKGFGLIEKKRQGQGKPDIIFVKNFITATEQETVEENGQNLEIRKSNIKKAEKRTSRNSMVKKLEDGKSNTNKNEDNNTNKSDTNLILSDGQDMIDEMSKAKAYTEIIKTNIAYEDLVKSYPLEKSIIDEIFELILETILCKNKYIIISSNQYPVELVRSKFLKIGYSHVEYVLECMQKNTTDIKNIKKYMLAALFNAPSTIQSYYNSQMYYDRYKSANW